MKKFDWKKLLLKVRDWLFVILLILLCLTLALIIGMFRWAQYSFYMGR